MDILNSCKALVDQVTAESRDGGRKSWALQVIDSLLDH